MTRIRNLIFRGQKGIGLLELMLSLAIIAILLVMATRYYITASTSSDINQVVSSIQALKGCYANSNQDLTNFSVKFCVDHGWYPSENKSSDTEIKTPWGSATVAPDTSKHDVKVTVTTFTDAQANALFVKLGGSPTSAPSNKTVIYYLVSQATS